MRPAAHLGREAFRAVRNAELERERGGRRRAQHEVDVAIVRIRRARFELDVHRVHRFHRVPRAGGSPVRCRASLREFHTRDRATRRVLVHHERATRRSAHQPRQHRDAARHARDAAQQVRGRMPRAGKRRVVRDVAGVRALRREQRVVHGQLDFLRIPRIAAHAQQPLVQLQPRDRDAALGDVRRLRRREPAGRRLESLESAHGAGRRPLRADDVLPRLLDGRAQARIAVQPMQVEQADEVRQHLVGLRIRDLVDAAPREQRADDARPVRPFGGGDDVLAEGEEPAVAGASVQRAHRLEHARRRHADVLAGRHDVALTRRIAERRDQQRADAPARVERRGGAGRGVHGQQADQHVLVDPYVPRRPASLARIGAEIAVGLLRAVAGRPSIAMHRRPRPGTCRRARRSTGGWSRRDVRTPGAAHRHPRRAADARHSRSCAARAARRAAASPARSASSDPVRAGRRRRAGGRSGRRRAPRPPFPRRWAPRRPAPRRRVPWPRPAPARCRRTGTSRWRRRSRPAVVVANGPSRASPLPRTRAISRL